MSRRIGHVVASRPSRRTLLTLFLATALGVGGCGYHSLVGGAPRPSDGASAGEPLRVAVRALRSESAEPWLDRLVGDALRREFDLRGAFRLVDDPAAADYVLRGRIQPLAVASNSFSSFVVAVEYRVTLSLDLEVRKRGGDVVRLAPAGLTESDIYLASPDVEVTRTNRQEALRHLSDLIAARAADSLEWLARPAAPGAEEGAAS